MGPRSPARHRSSPPTWSQVLAHLPANLSGVRDRALLLTGYTGGLRRSELAASTFKDLEWLEEGAVLTLRRSKTDQEGHGRKVAIPRGAHRTTCPVTALTDWIEAAGITEGPLFREIDRHGKVSTQALHRDSVGAILKMRWRGQDLTRRSLPGIRCGRGSRRRQRGTEPAPSTSCARPGTGQLRPCLGTFALRRSSGMRRPAGWGSDCRLSQELGGPATRCWGRRSTHELRLLRQMLSWQSRGCRSHRRSLRLQRLRCRCSR